MHIQLNEVGHAYRGNTDPTLVGITLDIAPGARLAVMGPSGSGKTTLLFILCLLLRPSEGSIEVNLKGVARASPAQRSAIMESIGWIFQTANVLTHRTALDNVAVARIGPDWTHARARSEAAGYLDAVGLGHRHSSLAATLSGGERQRVCIARALVRRPHVVLADEPTGQLDQTTTLSVMQALFHSLDQTSSLVIATHDEGVARLCDDVVEVRDGAIHFE